MKETLLMYARYSERANGSVLSLIDKLPPERRGEDRKSYYNSLDGLVFHLLGGTTYFLGLFAASMPRLKDFADRNFELPNPKRPLTREEWEGLKKAVASADKAIIALAKSITVPELSAPIKLDWYKDRETVPFSFLFHQLIVHGIHHRGQISQILDEMGVEHDFSGIDAEFM
jgi:uncharacterized damage-inducible protein DinB